jgi:hypothetical protein
MDKKGFLIRSEPDLIVQPNQTIVQQEVKREINSEKTDPGVDPRYRAYAAMMEDGRLVTDYRPACVTRAPPGTQFAVKQWSVHNADELMHVSRLRQVQTTGQALGSANTELPPKIIQHCLPESCVIEPSGYQYGIGIERKDRCPELFGTFQFGPDAMTLSKNRNYLQLNKEIAYGRNTPTRWVNLYQ